MASVNRYDDEAIKVQIKGMKLIVPANCFDSPIDGRGETADGYTITSGIYLSMLTPDLSCRTKENRQAFRELGPRARDSNLLIEALGPRYGAQQTIDLL